MLELPESKTISRQIKETLGGRRIARVTAAQSPHGFAWYFGDPAQYDGQLSGKRITDAYPVAGQIEIAAEDMRIVFHDGINARYFAKGAKLPPKHQLHIELEEGDSIVCTVQMYGSMYVFPEGMNDNIYYLVGKKKPSPLSDEFDWIYFERLYQETDPKLSVKALLATEQRIPGLGNGCLQDILFAACIHPQTKLANLKEEDVRSLYHNLKSTLAVMAEQGGRDTEKDFFGKPGGYRTVLSSKTLAYPCPACGGGIVRKAYMGGNVYYCPACQPVER